MSELKMRLKIKFKLFISVSDLVRAKESQEVIDKLMKKYDDNKYKDAEFVGVTPFSNGYLRGINIDIRCRDRNEALKYRKGFNIIYNRLVEDLERRPIKCTSLIDIEHLNILKF